MKKPEFKIIEKTISEEDRKKYETKASPYTYRVSIYLYENIELKREYFVFGYHDGEQEDKFFSNRPSFASILTRNFDPQHLQDIEKELIEKFYKKLIREEHRAKQELKKAKKECKTKVKQYKLFRSAEPFLKIQRRKKLEKLTYEK